MSRYSLVIRARPDHFFVAPLDLRHFAKVQVYWMGEDNMPVRRPFSCIAPLDLRHFAKVHVNRGRVKGVRGIGGYRGHSLPLPLLDLRHFAKVTKVLVVWLVSSVGFLV